MHDDLLELIPTIQDFPRPGILFYDVTGLVRHAAAYYAALGAMVQPLRDLEIDMVAGIEAQGYIFAAPVADRLRAGFVPLRKPGKLPRETIAAQYELEYATGQLELHLDDIAPGQRVVVIDDVVATGGTMEAALTMVKQAGGVPVAAACLVELMGLEGRSKIEACGVELFAALPVQYRP